MAQLPRRRSGLAALTIGLALTMTGCADAAPEGEALYQRAAEQYFPLAEDMHDVIMAIHQGEWAVDQGGYGALGVSCQRGANEFGYFLNYVRIVTLENLDAEAMSATAAAAFSDLGLEPDAIVRGEGAGEEHVVIAEGERIGRAVVTIRPARNEIRVTARTSCVPGSAHDVTAMVFGEERIPAHAARRLPATEGPDSVPQFYFPADGPVYYDENFTPVDPQPIVTEPPTAPYGDPQN